MELCLIDVFFFFSIMLSLDCENAEYYSGCVMLVRHGGDTDTDMRFMIQRFRV